MDKMGAVNFAAGHHAMQDHFPGSILINGKLYNSFLLINTYVYMY